MKTFFLLILSTSIISCSGGGSGGGDSKEVQAQKSKGSLSAEVKSIQEELATTSHQFSKQELDALLKDGVLDQEEYSELVALAQK